MILDHFRIDERVAIVTGGGRGIGAAIGLGLAEAGADVVLAARTVEQLEIVAKSVRAAGRKALVVPADMDALDTVPGIVDRTLDEFGRLDIVVNNAGGSPPKPLLDTSDRMFERAFHFNATTAFAMSKAAIPHLLANEGGGVILNISSAIGRLVNRGSVAYGTAKAALSHMTRLMAADLAPRIRVNAIAVGSVATSALETVLIDDDVRERMIEATPLKRLGQPVDIAIAALYLCSPAGSFVTGKVLEVDGGIESPNLFKELPDL
jgi:7-alpha-hydroxysteroid dehydrogenase